jgi:hypothetical protein
LNYCDGDEPAFFGRRGDRCGLCRHTLLATTEFPGVFFIQLAGFVTVTGLLLAGGVVPYRPGAAGSERMRLFVSGLEIIWWLGAAWLTVGFLRAFVQVSFKAQASFRPHRRGP